MIKTVCVALMCVFASQAVYAKTYRLVETHVEKIVVPTHKSYPSEAQALENAFALEDDILSKSGREFSIVKKACWNFVDIVEPTIVRLSKKADRYRGKVHVKVRCAR